ncbi:MAG TPA: MoaD/ThiS family protein [Ilumatobacter sp.]|nr:MoaD/ThiS family protein [Ilumatobacter sp.]
MGAVTEVVFAKAFRRHVDCPDERIATDVTEDEMTVGAVLDAYFELHPAVRSYVVDDLGAVRKHVAVFVDGDLVTDRAGLTDRVTPTSTVHVFQALSGG